MLNLSQLLTCLDPFAELLQSVGRQYPSFAVPAVCVKEVLTPLGEGVSQEPAVAAAPSSTTSVTSSSSTPAAAIVPAAAKRVLTAKSSQEKEPKGNETSGWQVTIGGEAKIVGLPQFEGRRCQVMTWLADEGVSL